MTVFVNYHNRSIPLPTHAIHPHDEVLQWSNKTTTAGSVIAHLVTCAVLDGYWHGHNSHNVTTRSASLAASVASDIYIHTVFYRRCRTSIYSFAKCYPQLSPSDARRSSLYKKWHSSPPTAYNYHYHIQWYGLSFSGTGHRILNSRNFIDWNKVIFYNS